MSATPTSAGGHLVMAETAQEDVRLWQKRVEESAMGMEGPDIVAYRLQRLDAARDRRDFHIAMARALSAERANEHLSRLPL